MHTVPALSELEIAEVAEALRSGWITMGPRTKLLERRLAAYIETGNTDVDCITEENTAKYSNRVVCLDETYYGIMLRDRTLNESGTNPRGFSKNKICIGVATDKRNTVDDLINQQNLDEIDARIEYKKNTKSMEI